MGHKVDIMNAQVNRINDKRRNSSTMTKPKPKPKTAVESARIALEQEEAKRGGNLKPIEVVKVALSAYQAYGLTRNSQAATPNVLAESKDRTNLLRGTQAAMDRLLFNVNYWRSAYEDRIVAACETKEDAEALLDAICAWTGHTMKLNTLHETQVVDLFARFCPPLVENNRRGSASKGGHGKGPVADFIMKVGEVKPHLPEEKRAALERIVADVVAEAQLYTRYRSISTLDAYYELIPAWCLQNKIELVRGSWWTDSAFIQFLAGKLTEKFVQQGQPEPFCTYFNDMVIEALDGYVRELGSVPPELRSKSVGELRDILSHACQDHPSSETDGYGSSLPSWLIYKEQLIWNIIACAIYGPVHARPFMADSMAALALDGGEESADVITKMARNAYGQYLVVRRSSNVTTEFDTFEQLPDDLHRSSVERIASFPEKLATLGYRIVPAASCYPEQRIDELAPHEVEVLAILEHRRWCEERTAAGWVYAETKNVHLKHSPYLVAWDDLPERAREWNRCSARDIPMLLAAEGLAISR